MKTTAAIVTGLWAVLAAPALAQEADPQAWMAEPRDWSAALVQDATALHDIVIDSHPGVHDPLNPAFKGRVDAGLALALERARTTTTPGGWWWAMRSYVAGFDDGHVQIGLKAGSLPMRWPGFLTTYRGADQIVADRDESDPTAPPLGARLIDCDGVPADRLAEERIGAFRGRWFLQSQRVTFGDWQFLSAANPWVTEMRTCRFESNGQTRAYALNWRSADGADLPARRARLSQRAHTAIEMKTLTDGGYWLSAPKFDGTPDSETFRSLTALVDEALAKQADLRQAPYVVLDLRGNGGGSSRWGSRLAVALWGLEWARAHNLAPIEAIDWRASEANQARMQAYADEARAAGQEARTIADFEATANALGAARAAGEVYWREAGGSPQPRPTVEQLVRGPVFMLTDPVCASACLDTVDLWKALGAIQVGVETSADTVYMEIRPAALPSDRAEVAIPMKVWRGRARGNNEPQRPVHVYTGDLSDDAAVQAWIAGLAAPN